MAEIVVVGTGFVGLVTGAGLAQLGHRVICVDTDEDKINKLNSDVMPFYEEGLDQLVREHRLYSRRLEFTNNLREVIERGRRRYIILAVPTPQSDNGCADLSYVESVLWELSKYTQANILAIIKSTVPVGCFNKLKKIFSNSEYHIELVSCPEFLAEGSAVYDFFHPSRIIVGTNKKQIAQEVLNLFEGLDAPRMITTPEEAQLIKYGANAGLHMKVCFINALARICEGNGADVHVVSAGIQYDKRFGNGYLRAGVGAAGPCLPKDLSEVIFSAKQAGIAPHFFEAIAAQNLDQLMHVKERISDLTGSASKLTIYGMAFKTGTSDVRNSRSIHIVKMLVDEGHHVTVNDPIALDEAKRLLPKQVICEQDPIAAAHGASVVAFLTAWEHYAKLDLRELRKVVAHPNLFDAPGIFVPEKVREAGFNYSGIGRSE